MKILDKESRDFLFSLCHRNINLEKALALSLVK